MIARSPGEKFEWCNQLLATRTWFTRLRLAQLLSDKSSSRPTISPMLLEKPSSIVPFWTAPALLIRKTGYIFWGLRPKGYEADVIAITLGSELEAIPRRGRTPCIESKCHDFVVKIDRGADVSTLESPVVAQVCELRARGAFGLFAIDVRQLGHLRALACRGGHPARLEGDDLRPQIDQWVLNKSADVRVALPRRPDSGSAEMFALTLDYYPIMLPRVVPIAQRASQSRGVGQRWMSELSENYCGSASRAKPAAKPLSAGEENMTQRQKNVLYPACPCNLTSIPACSTKPMMHSIQAQLMLIHSDESAAIGRLR